MNEQQFYNKKILILGGSYQHIKIVNAAKKLGVITYVTDFLPIEKSPAKQIADYPLMYNITDVENIVKFCQEKQVDGVIGPYLDIAQLPYQAICEKLGLPCFGNKDQFKILTDKKTFKDFFQKNGADIINSYNEKKILEHPENIKFPILIKPNDSRGSRGQTICHNINEVEKAIKYAKEYSSSESVIIETYMGNTNDVQITYMVIDEEPIYIRIGDRYLGEKNGGFDKLCVAEIGPSKKEKEFLLNADEKIKQTIKKIGLKNAPIFIQAFIDDEKKARVYDPGMRFPGDDYDDMYKIITGIDIPKMLVEFALTGRIVKEFKEKLKNTRQSKPSIMILPCLKPGKISRIEGFEELKQHPNFVSISKSYNVGDEVKETKDVRQRFGEFCIVSDSFEEMKRILDDVFEKLKVLDDKGENMLIEVFNTNKLKEYEI